MRRIFLIFIPISVFIIIWILVPTTISDLLKIESRGEVVSKNIDLGFINQEFMGTNYIRYKNGEETIGECVWFSGEITDLNRVCDLLGVRIIKKYKSDNRFMIEGVSNSLKYSLNNQICNVQIAFENEKIIVGSPIIYGSY